MSDAFFFHRDPLYFLTTAVLPQGFGRRHPEVSVVDIEAEVHEALWAGGSIQDLRSGFDWSRSRAALEQLLARYGERLPPTPTVGALSEEARDAGSQQR